MYIIHGSLQVLCMWYNITMQLHHKVNLLGQILIGKFILFLFLLINISLRNYENPRSWSAVKRSKLLAPTGQLWWRLTSG